MEGADMNHTDTPWQIDGNRIIGNIDGGYGDDGSKFRYDVVCVMEDEFGEQLENWRDNAKLIVRAPEMQQRIAQLEEALKMITKGAEMASREFDDPNDATEAFSYLNICIGKAKSLLK